MISNVQMGKCANVQMGESVNGRKCTPNILTCWGTTSPDVVEVTHPARIQKRTRESSSPKPSVAKLGCGSTMKNESFLTFILHCARLALTLH